MVRIPERPTFDLWLGKGPVFRENIIRYTEGSASEEFTRERWQIFQDVWDVPGGLLFHFVKMEGPASGDLYMFVDDRAAYMSELFVRRNTGWAAGLYDSWSTVRCESGQPVVHIRPVLWPSVRDEWPPRYRMPRRYAPISCTLTDGSFACRYPEEPAPVREWRIGIRQWAKVRNRQPF
ncbi:MAG: hypothetical protein IAE99_13125 [Rhodothermales bacterium]|nr:hypothetical protein [Rhodothermales bacterium]